MSNVQIGIDRLLENPKEILGEKQVGLICNQASVNSGFHYTADLLFDSKEVNLTTLFGPQHGIRGDVQDNMIETDHSEDPTTGLPVYSLYSETREPTEAMLSNVDTLVFDLQDIGGRVYTFVYTMANAMIACARFGKKFVVLDRPNPIGGSAVEGNLLEKGHESFVGKYPIPMRHGMTAAELAGLFNAEFGIGCDLEVVQLNNWDRSTYMDENGAPWVPPSPNMPTVNAAVVFPGTVFIEGTEISEGRGTTTPFEIMGAPYIDADVLARVLNSYGLSGVYFRATNFIPTFQKFAGQVCGGVFMHVTDRARFRPVISGIAVIKAIYDLYEDQFLWKQTAYEYEFDRNPFDVIAGTTRLREMIEKGSSLEDIQTAWKPDEELFAEKRSEYLLY